ncbi:hypothetical protein SAMN05421736_11421 [Evansella caseinilytica]|uniref:Uncharacterized protein n=1 Tax=Evansella caseinilytica TaxID=1503961 RepID=A0A1H3TD44_9BACI|nr:hypothetical protein SAMN05421736_11421 [Evansella caseinilytica]
MKAGKKMVEKCTYKWYIEKEESIQKGKRAPFDIIGDGSSHRRQARKNDCSRMHNKSVCSKRSLFIFLNNTMQ